MHQRLSMVSLVALVLELARTMIKKLSQRTALTRSPGLCTVHCVESLIEEESD